MITRYFVKFHANDKLKEYTEEYPTINEAIKHAMANAHLNTEVIRAEWQTIWSSSDDK